MVRAYWDRLRVGSIGGRQLPPDNGAMHAAEVLTEVEFERPQQSPSRLLRLFPSLTDVAFLMPLLFLFLTMGGASRMLEGDTGWHLRAGEWMLANGRVPDHDLFSFTKPGEPWFAWEWLWDVIFAWLHARWGLAAVVLASLAVISLTAALLYRLSLRKTGNPIVAIAVTWAAMAASSIHWWARPHVFTMLFVVIFYGMLDRHSEGARARLWLLPLLMVLWTNLHGGFLAGLVLIGAYAAGEILAAAVEADPALRRAALRRSLPYLGTGAACLLATLVNPYTWRLHLHIAGSLGSDSPMYRWINEWMSVSFFPTSSRYFEALIVLGAAAALWSLLRRRFVYAILILGWMHQALVAARHIPIFAIVAAPVVGEALVEAARRLAGSDLAGWARRAAGFVEELGAEARAFERVGRVHLVSLAALVVVGALMFAPAPPKRFLADYDREKYPLEAIEKLGPEALAGDIFANDEWGDYLIYRLFPTTRVFVDGRIDFYGSNFAEEYVDAIAVKGKWEETLARYGVRTALLAKDSALAATMRASANWEKVYEDGVAILFRGASPPAGEGETSSNAGDGAGSAGSREGSGPSGKRAAQFNPND
jgi:hypothetical protein